jgi:hypothetical protein
MVKGGLLLNAWQQHQLCNDHAGIDEVSLQTAMHTSCVLFCLCCTAERAAVLEQQQEGDKQAANIPAR